MNMVILVSGIKRKILSLQNVLIKKRFVKYSNRFIGNKNAALYVLLLYKFYEKFNSY